MVAWVRCSHDLASLLYDAAPICLNHAELLNHYIMLISQKTEINESQFRETFNAYVLIRIMQAMGAYGFRGFYEKKEHFLKSIPFAMKNINYILTTQKIPDNFPTLYAALREITHNERLLQISLYDLTVTINSFLIQRGIPIDFNGHGGGFVLIAVHPQSGSLRRIQN